jgi:hypothetical protein
MESYLIFLDMSQEPDSTFKKKQYSFNITIIELFSKVISKLN